MSSRGIFQGPALASGKRVLGQLLMASTHPGAVRSAARPPTSFTSMNRRMTCRVTDWRRSGAGCSRRTACTAAAGANAVVAPPAEAAATSQEV